MKVTAKFRVHSIDSSPHCSTVRMSPVYSADPASENYSWSQATPGGEISMFITNPAAAGAFELNKEYIVQFEPA